MKETIKIDGKKAFKINTANSWAYIYNDYFGHDIMPELVPLVDTMTGLILDVINGRETDGDAITDALYGIEYKTALNLTWALAKNEDDSIPDPEEWHKTFDKFPWDEIGPQVFGTLIKSMVSTKKLELLQTQGTAALSRFIKSSSPEPIEA